MTKERWVLFGMDKWPVVGKWVRRDLSSFESEGNRSAGRRQPDGQAVAPGNRERKIKP